MKLLLINSNYLQSQMDVREGNPIEPLGLLYIASSVQVAGHQVKILDLCFSSDIEKDLVASIRENSPEAVLISFRNVESVSYFSPASYVENLSHLVRVIKEHTDVVVILGGGGFSFFPIELLNITAADYGIWGEGEQAVVALLNTIESGAKTSDIGGLVYREGHKVRGNWTKTFLEIDSIAPPDRSLIDHERYFKHGGRANLQTKRGCPFKCIYCNEPILEGKKVRLRKPDQVVAEIDTMIKQQGIRCFHIVDTQFNYPMAHSKEICNKIIVAKIEQQIKWTCFLNPGFVDEELINLMKIAGCEGVHLGVDTLSEKMLSRYGKSFNGSDVEKTIDLLKKQHLDCSVSIIMCGPGETTETAKETLERLVALKIAKVNFGFGMRIYPGTQLARELAQNGTLRGANLSLKPLFYVAPQVEEILSLVKDYCKIEDSWYLI